LFDNNAPTKRDEESVKSKKWKNETAEKVKRNRGEIAEKRKIWISSQNRCLKNVGCPQRSKMWIMWITSGISGKSREKVKNIWG
jgi:hypothetical protein